MNMEKKKAIWQMILAAFICAAVVVPGMVAVDVASAKEQAEQAELAKARKAAVVIAMTMPEETSTSPAPVPEETRIYFDVPLSEDLQDHIFQLCEDNGIDPAIIVAMCFCESTYDANRIGDGGNSFGLMQIQPRWHSKRMERLGCTDLLDPFQNVTVGVDYLCEQLNRYDGDMAKALVGYNQGSFKGTVTQYAKDVMEKAGDLDAVDR